MTGTELRAMNALLLYFSIGRIFIWLSDWIRLKTKGSFLKKTWLCFLNSDILFFLVLVESTYIEIKGYVIIYFILT